MKDRKWMLFILAVVLVLTACIGSAYAYFTSNSAAKGGYVIHISDSTEIKEEVSDWTKHVTILNKEGGAPVFVRVKAFCASPYELEYDGKNWTIDDDGFYRYAFAVDGGSGTGDVLDIKIKDIPEDAKPGDDFNIIVVYESVPAVFHEDGSPDRESAWAEGEITVLETEGGSK